MRVFVYICVAFAARCFCGNDDTHHDAFDRDAFTAGALAAAELARSFALTSSADAATSCVAQPNGSLASLMPVGVQPHGFVAPLMPAVAQPNVERS